MKNVLFSSLLFCLIVSPTFGELSRRDLDEIRLIIKEEIAAEVDPIKDEISEIKVEMSSMKTEISQIRTEMSEIRGEVSSVKDAVFSVKEDVASLEGRVGGVEKQISWLMGIIIAAVGIPQIVIAWRSRKDKERDQRIDALAQEIETLKQQRIVNP